MLKTHKYIMLAVLRATVIEIGPTVSGMSFNRFFGGHVIAHKKTGQALEQDRPNSLKRHRASFDNQLDINLDKLAFVH